MRWDRLFDDLGAQLGEGRHPGDHRLRSEEERLRLAKLTLRERLSALAASARAESARVQTAWAEPAHSRDGFHTRPPAMPAAPALTVALTDGTDLRLLPTTVGRDWLAATLIDEPGVQCVLPLVSIAGLHMTQHQAVTSAEAGGDGGHVSRVGFGVVLRDLCRRRRPVHVMTRAGAVHGTIDRVAADHLDLAVHAVEHARRNRDVVQIRLIALAQIVCLRLI